MTAADKPEPTPRTDKVQSDHALAWFGLSAHLDRAIDEANKMREHARTLERALAQSERRVAAAEAEAAGLREALRDSLQWIADERGGYTEKITNYAKWRARLSRAESAGGGA